MSTRLHRLFTTRIMPCRFMGLKWSLLFRYNIPAVPIGYKITRLPSRRGCVFKSTLSSRRHVAAAHNLVFFTIRWPGWIVLKSGSLVMRWLCRGWEQSRLKRGLVVKAASVKAATLRLHGEYPVLGEKRQLTVIQIFASVMELIDGRWRRLWINRYCCN